MASENTGKVREAIGVFSEEKPIKNAIDELLRAGVERSQLGILASEHAVQAKLGDYYRRTDEKQDPEKAPAIAFVNRDSVGEVGESMGGSLYFIGTSGLAGAIVASSAIIGGAMTAAAGGIIGLGLVGLVVASIISQSAADELQQRVEEGHILLFVRLADKAQAQQTIDILSRFSASEVKVHEVNVKTGEHVESV